MQIHIPLYFVLKASVYFIAYWYKYLSQCQFRTARCMHGKQQQQFKFLSLRCRGAEGQEEEVEEQGQRQQQQQEELN